MIVGDKLYPMTGLAVKLTGCTYGITVKNIENDYYLVDEDNNELAKFNSIESVEYVLTLLHFIGMKCGGHYYNHKIEKLCEIE